MLVADMTKLRNEVAAIPHTKSAHSKDRETCQFQLLMLATCRHDGWHCPYMMALPWMAQPMMAPPMMALPIWPRMAWPMMAQPMLTFPMMVIITHAICSCWLHKGLTCWSIPGNADWPKLCKHPHTGVTETGMKNYRRINIVSDKLCQLLSHLWAPLYCRVFYKVEEWSCR